MAANGDKRLILNADDLGICQSTNEAIRHAHEDGVLTSASLMATGGAFAHAVDLTNDLPELGVGLHLCLTSGMSLTGVQQIPDLVDRNGHFRHGFVSLLRNSSSTSFRDQVTREFRAQFEKVLRAGVRLDHVDSHRHIHSIPRIFEIVSDLADEFGQLPIRVANERLPFTAAISRPLRTLQRFRNIPKTWVLCSLLRNQLARSRTRMNYRGVLDSGVINEPTLISLIRSLPPGTTEINTHPGLESPEIPSECSTEDHQFLRSPNRREELDALRSSRVRDALQSQDVALSTFHELTEEQAVSSAT